MQHFINTLPTEILYNIFDQFSFKERWRLCHVCKDWRVLMLSWNGMWTYLSSKNYYNLPNDILPYQEYMKGCWIRWIHLDTMNNNDELERLIHFLLRQNCYAIEKVNFIVPCINPITLSRLGLLCNKSMTDIYIDLSNNQIDQPTASTYNITLYMILNYFQNLIQLHYTGPIRDELVTLSSLTTPDKEFKHQHLKYLTLQIYNAEGNLDLNQFISATPSIEKLRLNFESVKHTIISLLSSIISNNHCPNFSTLTLYSQNKDSIQFTDHGNDLWANTITQKHNNENNSNSGLQHLILYDPFEKHYTTIQQILRFIIPQSHQTLKTLDISGAYKIHGNETMEILSQHVFPLLTRFYLINERCYNLMAYGSLHHFKTFAEHSVPNLINFKLTGLDSDYHMELPYLATSTKYLQEIYLEDCPEIDSSTLKLFFEQLGSSNRDAPCYCGITNNSHCKNENDDHPLRREVTTTNKRNNHLHYDQKLKNNINRRRRMTKTTFRNIPGVNFNVLQTLFQECDVEELIIHECDGLDMNDVGKLLFESDNNCIISRFKKLDLILTYYEPRYYFFTSKLPIYPNPQIIQETLVKLDASCMEWRLEFRDYSQVAVRNNDNNEPATQVYNHVEYRKTRKTID
ncbi:hypothetical protein BDC45DRAFT_600684 [Circinella umbellata]|nr:hypothetical protein BDC45DRAFT_600684 [Circinella umbellata]